MLPPSPIRSFAQVALLVATCLVALLTPGVALADDDGDDDFSAMRNERIGGLRIDGPAADVIKLLGRPTRRGKIVKQEADGNYVQTWEWKSKGVAIQMTAKRRGGPQEVASIQVTAPSTLMTSRGIRIGDDLGQLMRAYGKDRNGMDSTPEQFVVGSPYGGVIFEVKAVKVTSIFVGAAAE